MTTALIIAGVLALSAVLAGIWLFNRLVSLRNRASEAWSGIDVQLRRRHDLIPNLIEVAEAYRVHEASLFERVTESRAESQAAQGPAATGQAESKLGRALVEIFGVAENYPDLKASDVYRQLQQDLVGIEDEVQMARRYYNGTVRNLNTAVETFPSSLVARGCGFRSAEFYQAEEEARAVPTVPAASGA